MTRWRAVRLVARREILERGRSKSFLASLGLAVALILAGVFLPAILAGPGAGVERLGIVGEPPAGFQTRLALIAEQSRVEISSATVPDDTTGESRLREGSLDGLLVIAADGSPTLVVKESGSQALAQAVSGAFQVARIEELLGQAGIDPAAFSAAAAPVALRELEPTDPNRDTSFLFANVGVIILFISIFTFGTWVLTGVVEEKQSRVVEVVLATVKPRDLLVGKVVGIGLLGLLQLVVMVAVGLVAGTAAGRLTLPPTTGAAVFQLVLWFGLGYALYSTALGVLGALASRMEEASNASSPVSIFASLAYVFSLIVVTDDPSGTAARVATLIPPVAPFVVPLRAALGAIEPWEIMLAVALTMAAIWLLFVLGGRVYSGAVLATGGRIRLRDAWRAARD